MEDLRFADEVFDQRVEYVDDCRRIMDVILRLRGFYISLHQANFLWFWYSDSLCASWLMLPESDQHIAEVWDRFAAGGPNRA